MLHVFDIYQRERERERVGIHTRSAKLIETTYGVSFKCVSNAGLMKFCLMLPGNGTVVRNASMD